MKNKFILLIVSIITTFLSLVCALVLYYNTIAFGIFSGIFGSSLCFFIVSIIDYYVSRRKALTDYLDFVICFRINIKKIKLCHIEPENALKGILSLDGNAFLYYNRKYYEWLNSKDKNIRAIYYTIHNFAKSISDFKNAYSENKDIKIVMEELKEFYKIFFYKDCDIIKSFLDHEDFIEFVNHLQHKINDKYSLEFDWIAYYISDNDVVLDGDMPWKYPDSKIKHS